MMNKIACINKYQRIIRGKEFLGAGKARAPT